MSALIVYCTVSSKKEAEKISKVLVENKLAACVTTVDKVRSLFAWNGKLCSENELLLIIKTKRELFDKIEIAIKTLHSYNVPEIIGIPVIIGSEDYLQWIEHETL